ncbi:MAG: hypothetical protein ACK41C_08500 [Phenylobacterium sp.]|uniref:hypothetical protein n=1 Tax=Phenylobacterium sp. TaxID=1871053 RepID=UPI00391935A0
MQEHGAMWGSRQAVVAAVTALLVFAFAGLLHAWPGGLSPSVELRRSSFGALVSMAAVGWNAWSR